MSQLFPSPARLRTIAALALPIVGGMVSQNVLNLIDTAMVGTLGDAQLAAVGIGGMASFVAMAFITGLSVGVQAMAARRKGEGRTDEMAVPLNGGLLLAGSIAVPLGILLFLLAPSIVPLIAPDATTAEIGVPYLQARFCGLLAVGANYSFRGYWNGVNLSRLYMRTLVVMHAANVLLNWLLIFGNLGAPQLGATGAGIASAAATYIGTGYYFYLGLRHARPAGFLRGIPDRAAIKTMLRLAVPSGIQQQFFAASLLALFAVVAKVGTSETAAAHVLFNIMLVAILPGVGLGISAATLVGQSLGAGRPDEAARWGWDVVRVGVALLLLIGAPMVFAPELLLRGFIHNDVTLDIAAAPLMLVGATICLDGVGVVLMQSLMGAGATRTTMSVSVLIQWALMLPLSWLVGLRLGYGLLGIWFVQGGIRGLQAVVYSVLWRRGAWMRIKV